MVRCFKACSAESLENDAGCWWTLGQRRLDAGPKPSGSLNRYMLWRLHRRNKHPRFSLRTTAALGGALAGAQRSCDGHSSRGAARTMAFGNPTLATIAGSSPLSIAGLANSMVYDFQINVSRQIGGSRSCVRTAIFLLDPRPHGFMAMSRMAC